MLKLTSPNLPAAPQPPSKLSPGFRIYQGNPKPLAPLAKIDRYAHYAGSSPGFQVQAEPLGDPDFVGRYYRVAIASGFTLESVDRVGTFAPTPTPLLASPSTFWHQGNVLHLYAAPTTLEGTVLTADLNLRSAMPIQGNDIAVPIGFAAESIESLGLRFNLATNPGSPQAGEFTQLGATLTLHHDGVYRPNPADPLVLKGSQTIALETPISAIATFDLAQSPIVYLDTIDYLGMGLVEARDPYSPTVGEFLWYQGWTTLFLPIALAGGLAPKPQPTAWRSGSGYGTISYQEPQG